MADLDLSLFSRRPDVVHLIAAGATEQTRNRGRHGRPNAVVRSARERRADLLGADRRSIQQRRDIVEGDVR
ncbi:hypothetical protein [Nitrobacter sp. TKz-YC02]|uniref:hypothetical protein n=1 Tax=Nitrobacter sp. TKz-YC02 TaxID=3398704 RepID=UPI003CF500D4